MARLFGKKNKVSEDKMLDVDASMQGTMIFKDPVNLRINGKFDGTLSTKGNLIIGENATVNANIEGDDIVVAGIVNGTIKASVRLRVIPPARITGDINMPVLSVTEGAIIEGKCNMVKSQGGKLTPPARTLSVEEVSRYLEVKPSVVIDWASQGKIPARKDNNNWKFEKAIIDEWVLKERVK